jgi:hypothetical protein
MLEILQPSALHLTSYKVPKVKVSLRSIPISLTIDGQSIAASPGATVLEAAAGVGINIPHLCHLPTMSPLSAAALPGFL